MKKTAFFAVLVLSSTVFGLQAPFLYSADSVGDSTVMLTWRNNSTDYQGIIVLRKSETSAQFSAIDTAAGTVTSFTDKGVPPSDIPYVYTLTAFSAGEHADTSNRDTVRITPKPPLIIFFEPQRFHISWDSASHTMNITFFDSSTIEKGYKIFKSTNFGARLMIKDIPSSVPSSTGMISFNDSLVLPNTWYSYYGLVYSGDSSRESGSETFTFDQNAMTNELARNVSKKCILSSKIGNFPIKYKGWSLKAGDTIVLNETGLPTDSMFSMVNVSTPTEPIFAGTGISKAAQLGKETLTKGQYIIGGIYAQLFAFEYQTGVIRTINMVFTRSSFSYGINLCFLSDTTLLAAGSYLIFSGISSAENGYLLARYTLKNNIFTFIDTMSFLPPTYSSMAGSEEYKLLASIIWNGRYVINAIYLKSSFSGSSTDTCAEIVDFNYPTLYPKYRIPRLVNFPHIVDGILIEDPILKKANNVLIDTVKNLVFALSDTELSIYTCQIQVGTSQPIHSVHRPESGLQIIKGPGRSSTLIMLPSHSQPAEISIYSISGRLVRHFGPINGKSFLWNHKNLSGMYLIKADVNGRTLSTKVMLVR
jgi:hypothetical protein